MSFPIQFLEVRGAYEYLSVQSVYALQNHKHPNPILNYPKSQ